MKILESTYLVVIADGVKKVPGLHRSCIVHNCLSIEDRPAVVDRRKADWTLGRRYDRLRAKALIAQRVSTSVFQVCHSPWQNERRNYC